MSFKQSLPSRERELKLLAGQVSVSGGKSLPSRERELKLESTISLRLKVWSLPSRERELKHHGIRKNPQRRSRSPRGSVN